MTPAEETLASLATGTHTVKRRVKPTRTDGRPVAGALTTLEVLACVQPLSGAELQRLPEGLRTRELRAVWTATVLEVGAGANVPDLIVIDGSDWQVQLVEDWNAAGGIAKAIVARVS